MCLQAATKALQKQNDLPQANLSANINENVVNEVVAVSTTSNSIQPDAKLQPAPAQKKTAEAISKLEKELCGLLTVQNSGLATPEISKHIVKVEKDLNKKNCDLRG